MLNNIKGKFLEKYYRVTEALNQVFYSKTSGASSTDTEAKLVSVKGNTIKYNQLVSQQYDVELNRTSQRTYNVSTNNYEIIVGHQYFFSVNITKDTSTRGLQLDYSTQVSFEQGVGRKSIISSSTTNNVHYLYFFIHSLENSDVEIFFDNPIMIDLTALGMESYTVEQVEQWLSDNFDSQYLPYTEGTLLNFKGTGLETIRTMGTVDLGTLTWSYLGNNVFHTAHSLEDTYKLASSGRGGEYSISPSIYTQNNVGYPALSDKQVSNVSAGINSAIPMIVIKDTDYSDATSFKTAMSGKTLTYELATPVTIDTLSIPTLIYFPDGMNGWDDTYDEMTPSKAGKRFSRVDLGSLDWQYLTTGSQFAPYFVVEFSGIKYPSSIIYSSINALCDKYPVVARNLSSFVDGTMCGDGNSSLITQLQIKDSNYTDAASFKSAMSGKYLIFELATPIETDIHWDSKFKVEENCTETMLPTQTTLTSTKLNCDEWYLTDLGG